MTPDNTDDRRAYLVREYKALNETIEELRLRMTAYSNQKADVVRLLEETGLTLTQVAGLLGVSRQTVYNLRASAKGRRHQAEPYQSGGHWFVRCIDCASESIGVGPPLTEVTAASLAASHTLLYNPMLGPEQTADSTNFEAELRGPNEGPRRFLVQHLDLGAAPNGQNWTAYHHTLDEAMAAADRVYLAAGDTTHIRQEIIDTATGEWRFRGAGSLGWSPPTRARVPDVDMEGLLSTGEQGRRYPEE